MARKRAIRTLADGKYLAICRQATFRAAAVNGHSAIWPQAVMVISGDSALFYREDEKVWSCNSLYAANQFDVTPLDSSPETAAYPECGNTAAAPTFDCARCKRPYQEKERVEVAQYGSLCELCADEVLDLRADALRAFTAGLCQDAGRFE